MTLIEKMSHDARAVGLSYGQYVAMIEPPGTPISRKKAKGKFCEKCGAEIINPGKGHRKVCDACRSSALSNGLKKAGPREEWSTQCANCGAEITTTQRRRKKGNVIYCPKCREARKKEREAEAYRKRKQEKG